MSSTLVNSVVNAVVFAFLGIVVFTVAFLVMDKLTPYHLWKEIVQEHNTALASGADKDPLFGRPLARLEPIHVAPFYAIQFLPLARKNFGGVRTDLDCRVLRPDGTPIDGGVTCC